MDWYTNSKILYHSGGEMYREYCVTYGIDAARLLCNRYLDLSFDPDNTKELQFRRELYRAMYN